MTMTRRWPSSVIANRDELAAAGIVAGRPAPLRLLPTWRARTCACLDGQQRPGFAFFPSATVDGEYTVQIASPGRWCLLLFAERTVALCGAEPDVVVEEFVVRVADGDGAGSLPF